MTSISIRPAEQPITEDDAFIRRAVAPASMPTLMMSLVHVTGDAACSRRDPPAHARC